MNDRIIAVTPPDDLTQDANRILIVDLIDQQMALVSQALTNLEKIPETIFYIWKVGDDADWLIDKKQKSDLIIFNAESLDQTTVGYMAAQSNSCYFGNLKSLKKANVRAIYDVETMVDILERKLK
jgi:hypothetical protein